MRVLVLLVAMVAAPLVESVAQSGRKAGRSWRTASHVDQKCEQSAKNAPRQVSRDDDDDDDDRRSSKRVASNENGKRRSSSNQARRDDDDDDGDRRSSSNQARRDDDDDDDGDDRRRTCEKPEPPSDPVPDPDPKPDPEPDPDPSPTTPDVSGIAFHDVNEDGIRDAGDRPLAAWVIKLIAPDGQGNLLTVTDESGTFKYTQLAPGSYVLCQEQERSAAQTLPFNGNALCGGAPGYSITLPADRGKLWDFGNLMP